jgi:hypothetical protein
MPRFPTVARAAPRDGRAGWGRLDRFARFSHGFFTLRAISLARFFMRSLRSVAHHLREEGPSPMSMPSRINRDESSTQETAPPAFERAPMPAAVKITLVLVAINVVVAAMVLLKLRAPHLG